MTKQPLLDKSAIDNEKAALLLLINEMQNATNDDDRESLSDAIQAQAAKLQAMCDELQGQADEIMAQNSNDATQNVFVEVVLTPEQRARVLEKTGIDVPSVRIPDPTSELTKNMAYIQPEFIEQRAMQQAENFKQLIEDMDTSEEDSEDSEDSDTPIGEN